MERQEAIQGLHFLELEEMTRVGTPVLLISAKLPAQYSIPEGKAVVRQVYATLPASNARPQLVVLLGRTSLRGLFRAKMTSLTKKNKKI